MASVTWISSASGNWNNDANWSPNIPGPGDDATIGVAGTVTVTVNTQEIANSLTLASAGDTLSVSSGLTIGSTLAINAGTLALNSSGAIVGGTIAGGGVQFNAGTLSGVTYVGTLDLSASSSRVIIQNGITLTPAHGGGPDSVLVTGQFSYLDFAGSQTLSNAAVTLGNAGNVGSLRELTTGAVLTLDDTTSVTMQGRAVLNSFAGTIVNAGLITAGVSGGYVNVSGTLTNQGSIDVLNGSNWNSSNAVFNNVVGGAFALGAGSSATLGSNGRSFSNQGTITLATGAVLRLGGYFQQSNIGAITNSGGTVDITGTLGNFGNTLTTGAGSSLGTVELDGTIVGGTIVGGGLVFAGGTLSGASYVGTLDLSASNSRVIVANGIILRPTGGVGTDSVLVTGQFSYLDFAGTQTLNNAAISLGNGGNIGSLRELTAGGTLTLDNTTSVNLTGRGAINSFSGTIVNAGSITAGVSSGYVGVTGGLTNQGEIDVLNGSNWASSNAVFNNAAGGTFALGASSSATLGSTSRTFANQGTITLAAASVLRLGGYFTQGNIGAITNSGGTVDITGTLDNVGSVLITGSGSSLGTVQLEGTIVGGTIVGGGLVFNSGTLSGVTYVGALDLSRNNSRVIITNGITLGTVPGAAGGTDPVLVTGQFSYLDFAGSQTLSNAAVSLGNGGTTGSLRELTTGATLTLDRSTSVNLTGRGAINTFAGTVVNAGTITAGFSAGYANFTGTFSNQGEIDVLNGLNLNASNTTFTNAPGGVIAIGASSSATFGNTNRSFANQGSITVATGGVLRLAGYSTEAALGAITNTGGTVDIAGTLNNAGTVLPTGSGSGLGTVQLDGTIVGGTITGGGLVFAAGTLSGVNYVGPLDLSAANSRLHVTNGVSLSPVGGSGPDAVLVTGQFSYLDFFGSQTLGNAVVSLGGTTSLAFMREFGSNTTLTLDPTVAINAVGRAALSTAAGDTIVNAGSITANATSGYFSIAGAFTNQALLEIGNGTNLVANGATFTNATGAYFGIGANSSATIGSSFDPFVNQGTISLGSAALLHLGGSFNIGNIGLLNNAGGTVSIDGTLINSGSVLSTGIAGLGAVALHGTVVGGTVTGGGMLFAGGTLSGVDYVGALDLSPSSSRVVVTNGITLSPTGGVGLDPVLLNSSFGYLDFSGTQTLSNAAVTIGSTSGTSSLREIGANSILTLDPTVTITQVGRSNLGAAISTATMVNQGTIAVGVTNSYFGLVGSFINQGVIGVSGGAYLSAAFSVFDNAAGGLLSIGANSGASIGSGGRSWSNQGTISLGGTGAYLRLGGSFGTGDIGAISNAGGTVSLFGTLANTGNVLTTGSGSGLGTVKLVGTVVGGTVTGGGMLFGGGTLSGVSYIGTLDLSQVVERVIVTNGITLNPVGAGGPGQVLLTGQFGYLDFTGSQTFSNAAVTFGANVGTSLLRVFGSGSVLTLDPTVSITQTGRSAELYATGAATMINAGTISAGVTTGGLTVLGNFVNQGVVNAAHGETVSFATLSGAGSVNLASGAAVSVSAAVGSGETIRFADQTGRLTLNQGGSFAGSILGFRTGDVVDLRNIGTAASYLYDGALHQLTLKNAGGTQIAQVSLATALINPQFTLANDFANGALVTVTGTAAGTLTGIYNQGIVLANPGLQNPTVVAATAYIGNSFGSNGGDALYGTNAVAWTVTNYGTIRGTAASADGIDLRAGGTIINQAAGGTGGTIFGGANGVYIGGAPGTVANYGAITGGSGGVAAIELAAGGSVTNGQTGAGAGAISGYLTGVYAAGGGNTVINFGMIGATGSNSEGIHFGSGGTVVNAQSAAVISGGLAGIDIDLTPGIIVNLGTIIGGGANGLGLYLGAGHSTVTNIGTIVGNSGIAVVFGGIGNRLIVDPGAVFAGGLNGGDGGDTLELEAGGATGAIGGLGTAIIGFDTVQIDTGADWLLTGSNALGLNGTLSNAGTLDVAISLSVPGQLVNDGVIDIANAAVVAVGDNTGGTGAVAFTGAAGTFEIDGTTMPSLTIAGFGPGDTIDLRAIAGGNAGSGSIGAGNLLTVVEGGTSYDLQLDPAQNFTGQGVVLSDDGLGGTFVRVGNPPLIVSSGQVFTVLSGQTFDNILVLNGGLLNVLSGGTAIATTDSGTELLSGGVEIGAAVSGGGSLSVSAGGVLSNATAAANGEIFVLLGGVAAAPEITSGGVLDVESGGAASGAIVSSGGSSLVTGVASGTVIDNGGRQQVLVNGNASSTIVNSGGEQFVSTGGSAIATSVNGGGIELVEGLALGTAIASQGLQLAESGGVASNSIVASGGVIALGGGGTLISAMLNPGAALAVADGYVLNGFTVGNGAILDVGVGTLGSGLLSGTGSAVLTTVASGGLMNVLSGGFASATTVQDGGAETVSAGGVDVGAFFTGGTARRTIDPGGVASGAIFDNGAVDTINAGGITSGTTLSNGAAEIVNAGGIASATTLFSGTTQTLSAGAAVTATTLSGGTQIVLAGAVASGSQLPAGSATQLVFGSAVLTQIGATGSQVVETGGLAIATAVVNGGLLTVSSGGVASGANVSDGVVEVLGGTTVSAVLTGPGTPGIEFMESGGVAVATTVGSGGVLTVSSGGTASLTGVTTGGFLSVLSGGLGVGTLLSGGNELVSSGGSETGATAIAGGLLDVDGGVVAAPTIGAGGVAFVLGAGSVSGATVNGGNVLAGPGGSVLGATVSNGGSVNLQAGGIGSGITLSSGGFETIDSGGTSFSAIVDSGGQVTVTAGGVASNTVVSRGAVVVSLGGTDTATTVLSGGVLNITVGGVDSGAVVAANGHETVSSGGSAASPTIAGGTLELQDGAVVTGTIGFSGPGGALQIDGTTMPGAVIVGLTASDTIDLRGVVSAAGIGAVLGAGNLVAVTSGGAVFQLQLDPTQDLAGKTVIAVDDGFDGTSLLLVDAGTVGPGQTLIVGPGQTVSGTVVLSGGTLEVQSGGTVSAAQINSGGTENVDSGGTDFGTSVGGIENVFGIAGGTQIQGGGRQTVGAGGVASGVTVSNAGQQIVLAGGTTIDTTIAGGSVDLQLGAAATGVIAFTAPAGLLNIDGTTMPAATIVGFDRSDAIDLTGFAPQAGDTVAFDPVTGVLTVSGNGITETLALSGVASPGAAFALVADGTGGTRIQAVPPAPTGLALQAASDSGVPGDDVTNVTSPVIVGTGEAGDGVTVFDGTLTIGSGAVQADGTWAVSVSALGEGTHSLTAQEIDAGGKFSVLSAALPLRIDLAAPVTATNSLQVRFNSGATPLGIAAPTDADDAPEAVSVVVTTLPGNGTVTLADGVTPVGLSQSLTVAQLAGLEFIPGGVGKVGTTGAFGYRVGDPAGNLVSGSTSLSVVASGSTTLYDFVFTYADGKDYYLGTVADDGTFAYQVGQTIAEAAGAYSIYNAQPMTTEPAGTVVVLSYSHGGAGAASTLPASTAAGRPDGTAGLGSEADTVLGTDGAAHPFSSSTEASFGTIALFGFIYTYADGAAFYSGTVADDGTLSPGTKTVTDGSGNILGTYTVFADGVTARAPGTVVVDRLTVRDTSLMPIHATAASVDGTQGLGSEVGSIPANGGAASFGAALEPSLSVNIVPLPPVQTPSTADVLTGEVTELFQEILGRDPVGVELSTYSAELANGLAVGSLRQTLAQSLEAQGDVNQLYQQILDRPGDAAGLANYTRELINGATLATVQLLIAQSPEAQADINQIYLDVFGTGADGFGLTSYMGGLANGLDIDTVRSLVTHSPAAADALTTLFGAAIGRTPDMAELAGMEDQLGAGATRSTLANTLAANRGAGGFTAVTAGTGSTTLTAATGTPTEFVFGNIAFGADTITGFDPTRDAVVLPHALVADLTTLQADTAAIAGGTLIALNLNQSITLAGVSLDTLSTNNFRIV